MFKKLLIASAVLAASTSVALAAHNYKGDYKGEAAPCPSCSYNYLTGPYVGFGLGALGNYNSTPSDYHGVDGRIFGGYSAIVAPDFYLAGELFVANSASVNDFKDDVEEDGVTLLGVRSTWSYGLSVLPGMMINDHTVGFLRLGVVETKFRDEAWGFGGQAGIGMQTAVNPSWDVRTEYVHSFYRTVDDIGHPRSDQFEVSFIYKIV